VIAGLQLLLPHDLPEARHICQKVCRGHVLRQIIVLTIIAAMLPIAGHFKACLDRKFYTVNSYSVTLCQGRASVTSETYEVESLQVYHVYAFVVVVVVFSNSICQILS
jgi:hypothetical protein